MRGLMLVWMTMTHLPTAISAYSYQPIGFVSSAEGFIFLSALFTGLIYFRTALRDGYAEMRSKLWARTLKIYAYHLLMIGSAFLIAPVIAGGNHPGLHNLLDFYFSVGPTRAAVDAALLIYRPPLLDILPMYVIFMALSPLVIMAARRIGWKFILGASAVLWILAQLGLREAAYGWMGHAGLRIPAAVLVPALMVLRYSLNYGVDLGRYEPAFDKWHLGIVRVVEFVCIGALLVRFHPFLKWLAVRPLVILGQASLQVFCTHIVFCFLGLALMREQPVVPGWGQVALPILTFATQYAVARKVVDGKRKAATPPRVSYAPAS